MLFYMVGLPSKEFYRMLDQGASYTSCDTNKENHNEGQIDLMDPFEDQTLYNPFCTGSSNPYLRGKRPNTVISKNFSKHPLRFQSSLPSYNQARVPVETTMSPPLTQDQLQRMEENRLRALAIRKEKQRNHSNG